MFWIRNRSSLDFVLKNAPFGIEIRCIDPSSTATAKHPGKYGHGMSRGYCYSVTDRHYPTKYVSSIKELKTLLKRLTSEYYDA